MIMTSLVVGLGVVALGAAFAVDPAKAGAGGARLIKASHRQPFGCVFQSSISPPWRSSECI